MKTKLSEHPTNGLASSSHQWKMPAAQWRDELASPRHGFRGNFA